MTLLGKAQLGAALLGCASTAAIVACVDLFHDTSFTLPESDAATADVVALDAGQPDVCQPNREVATEVATRACARLATCATPLGRNATGRCLETVLPALSCGDAPGRGVRGPTKELIGCLIAATSCAQVVACVSPRVSTSCGEVGPGGVTACTGDVRVDCRSTNARPAFEACLLGGQRCDSDSGIGECTGNAGIEECLESTCDGTWLRSCATGRDVGMNCANVGAGECVNRGAGPACVPELTETCTASASYTCSDGVASGCPAGKRETLECSLFNGTCHAADAGAEAGLDGSADASKVDGAVITRDAWDLARACNRVERDGGLACTEDTCAGSTLIACVRGNAFEVRCAELFPPTGGCGTTETADGPRAACIGE